MTTSDLETSNDGPEPPAGVLLEYPPSAIVRIAVRIAPSAQLLIALPRIVLTLVGIALLVESWRHHFFIAFWFFGLPFLRWLRGARQSAIVVRERGLELEAWRFLGGPLLLPRNTVSSIEIGRAGFSRLFQRALVIHLNDRRTGCLFVGLSQEQAEFVDGGLQRWLAGDF